MRVGRLYYFAHKTTRTILYVAMSGLKKVNSVHDSMLIISLTSWYASSLWYTLSQRVDFDIRFHLTRCLI